MLASSRIGVRSMHLRRKISRASRIEEVIWSRVGSTFGSDLGREHDDSEKIRRRRLYHLECQVPLVYERNIPIEYPTPKSHDDHTPGFQGVSAKLPPFEGCSNFSMLPNTLSALAMTPVELAALEQATKNLLLELFELNDPSRHTTEATSGLPQSNLQGQRHGYDHNNTNRNYNTVLSNSTLYRPERQGYTSQRNISIRSVHFASFSSQPNFDDDDSKVKEDRPTPAAKQIPSHRLGPTRIPTPHSAPPIEPNPLKKLASTDPKSIVRKGVDLTIHAFTAILRFFFRLPGNLFYYLTHPVETRQKWAEMKQLIRDEVNHYWVGTKLLWADIQTARNLLNKTLRGWSLTRRERKQLLRTVSDLFRVVPFSMFIIIPLGEFALPFVLKVFPNLLPSTFQDSLKNEENMKRELQTRLAMAKFFQETLEELAKEQKRKASTRNKELKEAGIEGSETIVKQEDSAASMLEFLENARNGEPIPPDVIIRYAKYFQDDLTLDNMPRMQLINMCKYMGITPYGSDSFLRFQLRHRIRVLKEDDQRILWEGIDTLTKMELREACRERGMRSTGLSKDAYKRALQQWLELSVVQDVPISLLIMSRSFFLRDDIFEDPKVESDDKKSLAGLADAISGLDKEVLNEVILNVATSEEKRSDPDVRKIKLEVLSKQNELIRQEEQAREAAKKREKGKAEAQVPLADTTESQVSPDSDKPLKPAELVEKEAKPEVEPEKQSDLSSHEMDAISQLVTEDPVSKERAELERIKAAMKNEDTEETKNKTRDEPVSTPTVAKVEPTEIAQSPEPISFDEADRIASVSDIAKATSDAAASTTFTTESQGAETAKAEEVTEPEDRVVARLKKRLESMVDKIEVQLSQTEVKIGDKLHFLDKDKDGLLTREEMAEVLMHVLKRKVSIEEALMIANEMDENQDGVFTVQELIKWIDENKLVKFVREGRDADMDRVLEKHTSSAEQRAKDEVPKSESKSVAAQ